MRRHLPWLIFVMTVACGGGGSGVDTPNDNTNVKPLVVPSGTFDVTSELIVDHCDQNTDWNGPYDVEIDGTSFSMGPWTGTWTAANKLAVGESTKDKVTTRNCTATRWSTVYLTFYSADHFRGTIIYRLALGGDCGTRVGCSTSWTVVGDRQVPAN
ncbi:MAG TPA: hypothetical protein VFH88_03345 [Candidatus Krumholzibacteria bacterium]|nr:hypothetical protein [Candidatus Krumholzibacteria bacterium]